MFVSVVCECASDDHRIEVYKILRVYGLSAVLDNTFEGTNLNERSLLRLKREIDKATDYYDSFRFYQYPVEGKLVITILQRKKWKRIIIHTEEKIN